MDSGNQRWESSGFWRELGLLTRGPTMLQRTRAGCRGCNRRASWPPSLTYIGSLALRRTINSMNIPTAENALLIRTDFSDQSAWRKLTALVREPTDPFIFNMEIVD